MSKGRFSLGRIFQSNKLVFILSVAAALTIWVTVSFSENSRTEIIIKDIPLNFNAENTALSALGLSPVKGIDQTVNVTIDCKKSEQKMITKDDINITGLFTKVTEPDEYPIEIVAGRNENSSFDFEIVDWSPKTILIEFDRVITRDIKVTARAENVSAAEGLVNAESEIIDQDKTTIEVEGAESLVNSIDKVEVIADMGGKTLSKTENAKGTVVLYDASGKELDQNNLTLSFTSANVSVIISMQKNLKVVPTFINIPPAYEENSIAWSPSINTLTISGPPEVVEKMENISLKPIDYGKITLSNYRFECELDLPAGVKLNQSESVSTVRITISTKGLSSKTLDITQFKFANRPSGKTVQAVANSKLSKVLIIGPRASINALTANDLYGEADLTGKTSGEYEVTVKIKSDKYKNIWAQNNPDGEYKITIKIS